MRFNCSHSFILEAEDREEFEQKIADYGKLVRKASERLGIGYSHGLVFGQPSSDRPQESSDTDEPLEKLFT